MKNLKFRWLAGALSVVFATEAYAQGILELSSATGNKPRIVVDYANAGPSIKVELLVAGATALTYSSSGAPVEPFSLTLTGNDAGLFSQGVVIAQGIQPGATAVVTIRAWDSNLSATFDSRPPSQCAEYFGHESVSFNYVFGGAGIPPSLPGSIVGPGMYQGLSLLLCPEPGTYALAALGFGGLLFLRKK